MELCFNARRPADPGQTYRPPPVRQDRAAAPAPAAGAAPAPRPPAGPGPTSVLLLLLWIKFGSGGWEHCGASLLWRSTSFLPSLEPEELHIKGLSGAECTCTRVIGRYGAAAAGLAMLRLGGVELAVQPVVPRPRRCLRRCGACCCCCSGAKQIARRAPPQQILVGLEVGRHRLHHGRRLVGKLCGLRGGGECVCRRAAPHQFCSSLTLLPFKFNEISEVLNASASGRGGRECDQVECLRHRPSCRTAPLVQPASASTPAWPIALPCQSEMVG